jgi:ankyrin repeat protein
VDRTDRNIAGETAYDIAMRWGRKEIAALLK